MTKKNQNKNNDTESAKTGNAGASENPIEDSQPMSLLNADNDMGSELPIEAEQAEAQSEPVDVDLNPQNDSEESASMDDILADVRHSLIVDDDQAGKGEKKSSWWNRLVKGTSASETPEVPVPAETNTKETVAEIPVVEIDENETDESAEEIDELIKLLETEDAAGENVSVSEATPSQVPDVVEPDAKIDVDELKKQAFGPRVVEQEPEEISDVRQIALGGDGDEDVFVEVESKAEDPLAERVKAVENALRPYRNYLYYGLAFIGVIMAVMASVIVYNGVKRLMPTPVATEVSNLPFPVMVSLPGGLNFNLTMGTLKNGSWKPAGPEWLEGTEICRWVAIPWSRQLEAAVRTMSREDVIDLHMSNNDKITYKLESIQELTPDQLQAMDSSTPCIAVILAKQDSETRWVAIGRP